MKTTLGVLAVVMTLLSSETTAQSPAVFDSLVLERTRCFGACPAYRVRITSTGRIDFRSRAYADSSMATDSMPASTLSQLVQMSQDAGFFALPPKIEDDRRLCGAMATDHPTVRIALFGATTTHAVVDYRGCYASGDGAVVSEVRLLRRLESTVDSLLGTARWIGPVRRRP